MRKIKELESRIDILEEIIRNPFVFNNNDEVVIKYPGTMSDNKKGIVISRSFHKYMDGIHKYYNVKLECGHIIEMDQCYLFSEEWFKKQKK